MKRPWKEEEEHKHGLLGQDGVLTHKGNIVKQVAPFLNDTSMSIIIKNLPGALNFMIRSKK